MSSVFNKLKNRIEDETVAHEGTKGELIAK